MESAYPSHISGVAIQVEASKDPKCSRCWNHDKHIGTEGHHPELCDRCRNVLLKEDPDMLDPKYR